MGEGSLGGVTVVVKVHENRKGLAVAHRSNAAKLPHAGVLTYM